MLYKGLRHTIQRVVVRGALACLIAGGIALEAHALPIPQLPAAPQPVQPDPTFTIVEPKAKPSDVQIKKTPEELQGELAAKNAAAPGIMPLNQLRPVPLHPASSNAVRQDAGRMALDTTQDRIFGMDAAKAHRSGIFEPAITSTMCCLVTADGKELFSRHMDDVTPMASLTKMMTALVVLESGVNLNDKVTISEAVAGIGEGVMGYKAGEQHTVRVLLEAALIRSGNDAAQALGEYVGGGSIEPFLATMNKRAQELGCTHTHFTSAHGLDNPDHCSTVRDLLVISKQLMKHPLARKIVDTRTITLDYYGQPKLIKNTNPLLGTYPGERGIKTGYTDGAGYSLVSNCIRGGAEFYCVVLGTHSPQERAASSKALLDWGYRFYPVRTIAKKGEYVTAVPYVGRFGWSVPLVMKSTLTERAFFSDPWAQKGVSTYPTVPHMTGRPAGYLKVYRKGAVRGKAMLVAKAPVPTCTLKRGEPFGLAALQGYVSR